tara:strand:- start:59393 stop:60073 length:681 start_codon:yes stop_codon:yes gene_type:complete
MTNAIVLKSSEFLKAVLSDDKDRLENLIFFKQLSSSELSALTDLDLIVVWINLYNAVMQLQQKNNLAKKIDKRIFSLPIFEIAEQVLSLDIIEHGILRGNKAKRGLGFLPGSFLNSITESWACKKLEPRIHFLLNCGAESCPMIRVLTLDTIEIELVESEKDFILAETTVNHEKRIFTISSLFLFYWFDFGGKKNIKSRIHQYHNYPTYKIRFKKWNWESHFKKVK